jgi:putative spermidine/putrescine transport system permease protein
MIGLPMLLMALVFLYPLAQVMWLSVSDPTVGVQNYKYVVSSDAVHNVFLTTLRICCTTTFVTLIAGYAFAYYLTHTSEVIRRVLFVCILIPMWVSVLVRAFTWIVLLRREGIINSSLMSAGLISSPLPLIWNEAGVVIGMCHFMLPYAIMPLYSTMRDVDQRLISAARGMGATGFYAFRRIFLPLTMPGIIGAAVLVFIFSLGFYVTPVILGGGRVLMIAEYTSVQIMEVLQWGIGTTLATVLVLGICLLLFALGRAAGIRKHLGIAGI